MKMLHNIFGWNLTGSKSSEFRCNAIMIYLIDAEMSVRKLILVSFSIVPAWEKLKSWCNFLKEPSSKKDVKKCLRFKVQSYCQKMIILWMWWLENVRTRILSSSLVFWQKDILPLLAKSEFKGLGALNHWQEYIWNSTTIGQQNMEKTL